MIHSIYNDENKRLWPKIEYYYAQNYNYYDMDLHSHPMAEIMYVVTGKCTIHYLLEGTEQLVTLKERDYIFFDKNIPHRLVVEKNCPCRMLNIEFSIIDSNDSYFNIQSLMGFSSSLLSFLKQKQSVIKLNDSGVMYDIIRLIHKRLEENNNSIENLTSINLLFAQLLLELSKQSTNNVITLPGIIHVKKTIKFIDQNFDKDISIDTISSYIKMSSGYLQRLFSEHVGLSIIEYTNKKRIEKAKILLETSNLPIVDIAIGVGFNNRQHFSQIFTRQEKISPGKYRKNKGNYTLHTSDEN